jgi:hypothetical protein
MTPNTPPHMMFDSKPLFNSGLFKKRKRYEKTIVFDTKLTDRKKKINKIINRINGR